MSRSKIKSLIINTRNILLVRKSFENFTYILNITIVFSHQFDSLNIESENHSLLYLKIIYLYISIWYCTHFSCSRNNSKTYLLNLINSFHSSISSMNSISIFQNNDRIKNFVIASEIFDRIFISRSNSNHLSSSRIFQNSIYSFSKSNVFFYSFDELNISLKIKFWIIISMKSLLTTSTLKSFYLLETRFENISIDHSKSISLSCYNDSINIWVREINQLFNKIFSVDNLISISELSRVLESLQELHLSV